jgi:hypothetical protein
LSQCLIITGAAIERVVKERIEVAGFVAAMPLFPAVRGF